MSGLFRRSIADLVPYEPGKPVEEVQRELGLDRVVKLASNEGPFPPFPAALEAIARRDGELEPLSRTAASTRSARRSPSTTASRSRRWSSAAGADGVIDLLSQATLDPGDDIVCGWPSFPSYVLDAAKLGAESKQGAAASDTYDLDGLLAAIGPRTKLVYVCHPNNPTGTGERTRRARARSSTGCPSTCSSCSTRRTSSTSTIPTTRTASRSTSGPAGASIVLRTFSKIYGLAGLRVGYGVAPADVVAATSKVRRAFDVTRDRAGGRAGEHRRRRRARAAAGGERRRARAARGHLPRARARAGRARRSATSSSSRWATAASVFEQLLRAGRDRPAARRLRRARGDPRLRRHGRGERVLRGRARTRPLGRLVIAG